MKPAVRIKRQAAMLRPGHKGRCQRIAVGVGSILQNTYRARRETCDWSSTWFSFTV